MEKAVVFHYSTLEKFHTHFPGSKPLRHECHVGPQTKNEAWKKNWERESVNSDSRLSLSDKWGLARKLLKSILF